MANTIENTTDEALLRSIIDGSIEGTFEDDTITNVSAYKFAYCSNLEKVNLPNVTTLDEYTFSNCGSLTDVILPKTELSGHSYQFNNCTSLVNVDVSGATNFNSGNRFFSGCTALKKLFFPSLTSVANASRNLGCSNLEIAIFPELLVAQGNQWIPSGNLKEIDFGKVTNFTNHFIDGGGGYSVGTGIRAIIIRTPSVPTLANTGYALQNWLAKDSTPTGDSRYNYNYNIYVPQSLISDYQNATNWSEYSSRFTAIEGSEYEHYWADGTPLGFENTSGMIAYYDVGNSDDWDSETKTITSHVENDFNAWRQTSNNQFNINNAADIPTTFYDNCYMNGGFIINFGDGTTSNIKIEDLYDVITIEFLYASNNNSSININKALTNESIGTQIIGYVGGLGLTFKHVMLELSKTGTKLFINKVQKRNTNDNNINRPVININNSNNCYIGHVSVWNRELTSEEIEQHYDYYVDNFHVGETAFDSSGNFIAGQS